MNHMSMVKRLYNRELALPPRFDQPPKTWTNSLIDDSLEYTDTFYYKDLLGHYGCVNTVEFSPDGNFMISGGDDKRVFLWRLWDAISGENYKPSIMEKKHNSNIFCMSFDHEQTRIYSGGNDELVIVHNIETGDAIDVFTHLEDVYCISVNPTNNNIFASASNEISIWDLRSPLTCQRLQNSVSGVFHGVMYNPQQTNLIATASSKNGIELYDARQPHHRLTSFYPSYILNNPSAMCVRFNRTGNKILSLGRKLPPVLYDVRSPYPQLLFEGEGFFNLCTLKNCSFAGQNDQFVICGSDNFYIYMWKIPDSILNERSIENPLKKDEVGFVEKPIQILTGHRSIVNQVRFNDHVGVIASTGVEKTIRLWSSFFRFEENKSVNSQNPEFSREFFTYDFIREMPPINESSFIEEDIRLIAYFDSMLDRDLSFSSTSSSDDAFKLSYFSLYNGKSLNVDLDKMDDCLSIELDSNDDEKFPIQNRFGFQRRSDIKSPSNYLDLVYAKRMHVRYLISIIDTITKQIEVIVPDLKQILENSKRTECIIFLLKEHKQPLSTYEDLFSNVQNKKKFKLLMRANRFTMELYLLLITARLFDKFEFKTEYVMPEVKKYELDDIVKFLEIKDKVNLLAKKMSLIEERKLYDRRLRGYISTLYKKVLDLVKILKDVRMDSCVHTQAENHIDRSDYRISSVGLVNHNETTRNIDFDSIISSDSSGGDNDNELNEDDDDDNISISSVSSDESTDSLSFEDEEVEYSDFEEPEHYNQAESSNNNEKTATETNLQKNELNSQEKFETNLTSTATTTPTASSSNNNNNDDAKNQCSSSSSLSSSSSSSSSSLSSLYVTGKPNIRGNIIFKTINCRKRNHRRQLSKIRHNATNSLKKVKRS